MATIQRAGRQIVAELLRSPSMPTLLIICALAIGAAALVPLVQSSIATTTNGNVHRLEQQRDDWEARIQELELDVAALAGLDQIEKEARARFAMVEPNETRYIAVTEAPPEPRRLPSRYLPPEPTDEAPEPSIWQQLRDWLQLP